jgi:hypothetical protein
VAAPQRQRRSVERYNIVKRACGSDDRPPKTGRRRPCHSRMKPSSSRSANRRCCRSVTARMPFRRRSRTWRARLCTAACSGMPSRRSRTSRTARAQRRKFKTYPIGSSTSTSLKFAFTELHEKATRRVAADFLLHLINAVLYKIHIVRNDNGPTLPIQRERAGRSLIAKACLGAASYSGPLPLT